ncbi:hypothetical protein GCM10017687_29490 [Streptomyces echinatus]
MLDDLRCRLMRCAEMTDQRMVAAARCGTGQGAHGGFAAAYAAIAPGPLAQLCPGRLDRRL